MRRRLNRIVGFYIEMTSPFGQAYIVEENNHITHLLFEKEELKQLQQDGLELRPAETELLKEAKRQARRIFPGGAENVHPSSPPGWNPVSEKGVGGAAVDPVR